MTAHALTGWAVAVGVPALLTFYALTVRKYWHAGEED